MRSQLDILNYIYWFIEAVVFKDGELFIRLIEASVSDRKEDIEITKKATIKDVYPIEPNENSRKYTVHFNDVVLYQAYDECSHLEEDGEWDDGVISVCKNTKLIQYIKDNTLIFDTTPGELVHYCVKTAEEWYHVISREAPKVYETET